MNHSTKFGKSAALLLAAVMLVTSLAACGQRGNDGVYINQKYADTGMLTVRKNDFDYETGILQTEAGFGVSLTDTVKELQEKGKIEIAKSEFAIFVLYLTEKAKEEISVDNVLRSYAIARIPSGNEKELNRLQELFAKIEVVADTGEGICYFAYNDDYSAIAVAEDEKAELDALIAERETLRNGICLFPGESIIAASNMNMSDFSTKTLDGEVFTQRKLADYTLTMVNIWTTWCGPCVAEMSGLQELYETLPENVNLVTICADGNEEAELAKQILAENGCTFQTLVPDEKLQESLLKDVEGFPTTVFVDRDGNLVGEMALGVGEDPVGEYRKMIEDRLPLVENGVRLAVKGS